mgnify:CR=1 FL=1
MNNNNHIIKTGLVQKCSPRGMGTMWKLVFLELSNDSLKYYSMKDYDMNGKLVCVKYGSVESELLATEGVRFTDIEFDIWRPNPEDTRKNPEVFVCVGAQSLGWSCDAQRISSGSKSVDKPPYGWQPKANKCLSF